MSDLKKILSYMRNEIDCQIHFNECWDETFWLTLADVEDWLNEIKAVINDKHLSSEKKLQMIVDSITGID